MIRLVQCEVTGFGTLTDFRCRFDNGLNTFKEANGFGKSTFVAFIRAMFYGFPRANKTSLDKDPRRKYLPWQGGAYGGWLEWTDGEKTYRVERKFGAAPRDDTVKIYECTETGLRDTGAYSAELGDELFGLDADSFERTICLSQNRMTEGLYSNQIHAKLTNLIEDTNDINNFDSAIKLLRSKRSSYIPYRGNDGKAARARRQMIEIEGELEEAEAVRDSLEENNRVMTELSCEIAARTAEIDGVREKIHYLSAIEAHNALVLEKESLTNAVEKPAMIVKAMKERYPGDFPTADEMKSLDAALDVLSNEHSLDDDPAYAEANDTIFLGRTHFDDGVPSRETLDDLSEKTLAYTRIETTVESLRLTDDEQKLADYTESVFLGKCPTKDELDECREWIRVRDDAISQTKSMTLTPSDEARLAELLDGFKSGLPTDEDLAQQYKRLYRIEAIRQETEELEQTAVRKSEAKKTAGNRWLILTGSLTVAAIVAAIVLFCLRLMTAGAICVAAGLVLMILTLYLVLSEKIVRVLNEKEENSLAEQKRQILNGQLEAERLESELIRYVEQFDLGDGSPTEALELLQARYAETKALLKRQEECESAQTELRATAASCSEKLDKYLSQYFNEIDDYTLFVNKLELLTERYNSLTEKKRELTNKSEELTAQAAVIRSELNAFFEQYRYMVAGGEEARTLALIREEAEAYQRALAYVEHAKSAQSEWEKKRDEQCSVRDAILGKYQLSGRTLTRDSAREIWDDRREYSRAIGEMKEAREKLTAFFAEHADTDFEMRELDQSDSLEDEKMKEKALITELKSMKDELGRLEAKSEQMNRQVNQIPALHEALADAKAEAEASEKAAALLDIAINKLTESKDELSSRYLAPLKANYVRTIRQLMPESDEKRIMIDGELNVAMEAGGSPREIGYFSSGMADMMMLGMRVALVDALYPDNQPFLIFDDPFVNLDDEHMASALDWMKKMTEERQILYFVCHSGRTTEENNA